MSTMDSGEQKPKQVDAESITTRPVQATKPVDANKMVDAEPPAETAGNSSGVVPDSGAAAGTTGSIDSAESEAERRGVLERRINPDRRAGQSDPRTAELKLQKVSAHLKRVDTRDALIQASEALKTLVPNRYESWRAQADLWLAAIRQLQNRQLAPDDSVMLMGVPLMENKLRDAAEEALRQCAHFATNMEERIALIDEANSIRNVSWF